MARRGARLPTLLSSGKGCVPAQIRLCSPVQSRGFGMRCRKENAVLIAAALAFGANPASAQNWADSVVLDPLTWPLGSYELRLGGFAHGAAFAASQSSGPAQPDGTDESGATGEARAELRLQRIYDSGLIV